MQRVRGTDILATFTEQALVLNLIYCSDLICFCLAVHILLYMWPISDSVTVMNVPAFAKEQLQRRHMYGSKATSLCLRLRRRFVKQWLLLVYGGGCVDAESDPGVVDS